MPGTVTSCKRLVARNDLGLARDSDGIKVAAENDSQRAAFGSAQLD